MLYSPIVTTSSGERGNDFEGLSYTQTLLDTDPKQYGSSWSQAIGKKMNALVSILPFSFEFTDPEIQDLLEGYRTRMVTLGVFDNPYSSEDQRFRQRGLIGTVLLLGFDNRSTTREDVIKFFGRLGALDRRYNGQLVEEDPILEALKRGAQLRRAIPALKVLAAVGGEGAIRKALTILGG